MTYEPPTYTDEEILADLDLKAAHWERQALVGPTDEAWCCIDYAKHIRTMAECVRMDVLERNLQFSDDSFGG
jgi:hypothetical protein